MSKKVKIILAITTTLVIVILFLLNSENENIDFVKKENKKQEDLFLKGENLFRKNECNACHYIGMNLVSTAPALGGITKRRKKDWLYRYTKMSLEMHEEGDSIAAEIRKKGWGAMPSYPKLTNEQLDAIYFFVEKRYEMTLKGIPVKR
ncbi:cytochrome c [Flavobacterium sp.]|uniref:c-type cytochrome n=1 Tax=Flavobacterium sp. TaxID=239 RepID=UPI002B4B7780|nr:cytochrome c [Flavobacterium sp.]HLP63134.1 cytochrome c [Flavobacterium sp.]